MMTQGPQKGGHFGGGGGQGFGGGGVTYGAPEPPPAPEESSNGGWGGWGSERPERQEFKPLDFRGLQTGGSVQNGDFRMQSGDETGMYNSANQVYGGVTQEGIRADASMYNTEQQTMANMLASILGLEGINSQVGGQIHGIDSNERIQEGAQGVQTYGIDKNLEGQLANYANQLGMTDMTSGRNLEGRLAEIGGRQGIADTQAESARDVADLQNLRYKNQNEQYGRNFGLVEDWMANMGSNGSRGIGGESFERLDPGSAIAQAEAGNAQQRQSMVNSGGGGGASPQSGAYGARAAQMEAELNQGARTDITTQYANANNQNRLGLLKANADARDAQTRDRDGLLQFLSAQA